MADRIPWRPVELPPHVNGDTVQVLASVDALQRAWKDVVAAESEQEFAEARRRSLRRHAIETGVIERLYDVDWGVTQALVAEGLSAEVATREGGIDEGALETIRAQFEALSYLSEAASRGPALSVSFIRQLHQALCRTQLTYEALDQFGRIVRLPMRHGSWKELPNRAHTPDGRVVEFTPAEHVQSEVERLIDLNEEFVAHPVVRAAWLHHAFVSIHPFDDGNGRVARALALLVLLQDRYAPLVVDRFSRQDYLRALNTANDGDLRELVRLFARLEMVALRSELERPTLPPAQTAGALDVARAYVGRLTQLREGETRERATAVRTLAHEITVRVEAQLEALAEPLVEQFQQLDPSATQAVYAAEPPDERATWWRAQIIRTAQQADFYTNLSGGTWWAYLRLHVLGQQFRFCVVTQRVGRGETGVLALTVFAESVPAAPPEQPAGSSPGYVTLLKPTEQESVTFVSSDDVQARWAEVAEVVDATLAAALARFAEGLA